MHRKKFKPIINRIKLNPEQAVLMCTCYNLGTQAVAGTYRTAPCYASPTKTTIAVTNAATSATVS